MMRRKRRKFEPEFKLDTVTEGLRGVKSIAQIFREKDISDLFGRRRVVEVSILMSETDIQSIQQMLHDHFIDSVRHLVGTVRFGPLGLPQISPICFYGAF